MLETYECGEGNECSEDSVSFYNSLVITEGVSVVTFNGSLVISEETSVVKTVGGYVVGLSH